MPLSVGHEPTLASLTRRLKGRGQRAKRASPKICVKPQVVWSLLGAGKLFRSFEVVLIELQSKLCRLNGPKFKRNKCQALYIC